MPTYHTNVFIPTFQKNQIFYSQPTVSKNLTPKISLPQNNSLLHAQLLNKLF